MSAEPAPSPPLYPDPDGLCAGCYRPQPVKSYIWCFECGHAYRTRWHLLAAYWRKGWQLYRWEVFRIRVRRPSKIFFCQCCSHDF